MFKEQANRDRKTTKEKEKRGAYNSDRF